jgi:hypothetical protein
LRARREEEALVVTVENPGPYRGPRPGSDGVPTVRRRLAQAYGEAASLDLRAEGGGTTAELVLPA